MIEKIEKALQVIRAYCRNQYSCNNCALAKDGGCGVIESIPGKWALKSDKPETKRIFEEEQ